VAIGWSSGQGGSATWEDSPSLKARYRLSNERLADELRPVLAADAGLAAGDDRVRLMAAMLVAVIHLRYQTLGGQPLARRAGSRRAGCSGPPCRTPAARR
jgi:hypothetical protein